MRLQIKDMTIDAIIGAGVPHGQGSVWVKHGLAVDAGNQHNDLWCWKREALAQKNLDYLLDLYEWCKKGDLP